MAKKKVKFRKSKNFKLPLAVAAGMISPFISACPSGNTILGRVLRKDFQGAMYDFKEKFSGVDANGEFHFDWVVSTYAPMVVGALVSKFVGGRPLNLNRLMRDIPFVKI